MSWAASSTIDHQVLLQNTLAMLTSLSAWHISPMRVGTIDGAEVLVGGFGDVRQAILLSNLPGENVAIALKVLRPAGSREQRIRVIAALARELMVWSRLAHPNILTLLGFHFDETSLTDAWIATPWQDEGNLLKYIRARPLTGRRRLKLVLDTIQGLEYLHGLSPPVCHGDIKAENTVIDPNGNAQLCDFGLAKILEDVPSGLTTTRTLSCTVRYAAPELLQDDPLHTLESDMWAWGCLGLVIMTNLIPYHWHNRGPSIIRAIFDGDLPFRRSSNLMHVFVPSVLTTCWHQDPGARPTSFECRSKLNTWTSERAHRPRKKALLIGIQYRDSRDPQMQLPWTHVDVMEWKSVLIEQYGYSEADIVCLLDAEGYDRSLWPSHDNIVAQMGRLVAGTSKRDQRFFFTTLVAGHGDHDYPDAHDERDKVIFTAEYGKPDPGVLRDFIIRREMVEPLECSSSLIAVVDVSHCGTLLDLSFEVTFNPAGEVKYINTQTPPRFFGGDVICVSSCRDGQSTVQVKNASDPCQQAGILTTLILWYLQFQRPEPLKVQDLEARLKQASKGRSQTPMITCGSLSVMQNFDL